MTEFLVMLSVLVRTHLCNNGNISYEIDELDPSDANLFENANYCSDYSLLRQRSLQEILSRQLWRFSMINGGDQIDWEDKESEKFYIRYETDDLTFTTNDNCYVKNISCEYFISEEIAERAIEEIVKPFIEKHPDFKYV